MITIQDKIINKLKELPEYSLREVLEFVEFLTWREKESNQEQNNTQEGSKDDPILAVAGTLSFPPLTNDEIDRELYGPLMTESKS